MAGIKNQFYAAVCVNLAVFSYSLSFGWITPNVLLLQSKDTPLLCGPLTEYEISVIASMISIGAGASGILFGWLSDTIGRKLSLFINGPILLISWILVAVGTNANYLYVFRFLSGCATGGVGILAPLFLAEISDDHVRGYLVASAIVLVNSGTLVGFIAGEYLDYYHSPYIGIISSALFMVMLPFFPETPYYLSSQNRQRKAEQSRNFYKSITIKGNKGLMSELEELQQKAKINKETDKRNSHKIRMEDICSRNVVKTFLYSLILYQLTALSGVYIITSYVAQIFRDGGSNLSPNVNSIIVGTIMLCVSIMCVSLVEKAGRKILLIVSALGCGCCYTILGIYFYIKEYNYYDYSSINWLPLVTLSALMFLSPLGLCGIGITIAYEILPPKLRSAFSTISNVSMCITLFIMYRYFSYLIETIFMHNCLWFFAVACFSMVVFVSLYIPETKGKSFEEISREIAKQI